MFLVIFFVTCWRFGLLLVFLIFWFFLRNCTNNNIKLATATSSSSAAAAAAAAAKTIQFSLLMWRLNSAGPIKIPTIDIPQSPPSTTAQHLTQWHQIMVYAIMCESTNIFGIKFSLNWPSSSSCSRSWMNTALEHYMDGTQTYHVASLVHPLVLLEADMFSTVQEDLKN